MDAKKVAMGVGAAVVGLALVVAVGPLVILPREVTLQRSLVIDAPVCNVYGYVNNLSNFNSWSPWAEIDPAGTTYSSEGPKEGVGAKMSWKSDHENVGTGAMWIDTTEPCKGLTESMDFGANGVAHASWTFEPEGAGTKATWGFKSDMGMNPMGRFFGAFFMEGMLAPDYEKGLSKLKTVVEALPKGDVAGLAATETTVAPRPAVIVNATSAKDPAAVGVALGQAYGAAGAFAAGQSFVEDGPPMAIYTDKGDSYEIVAVLPVKPAPVDPNAPAPAPADPTTAATLAVLGSAPGGKVLQVTHIGPYAKLDDTHQKATAYLAIHGIKETGARWEEYVSDPGEASEEKVETRIYIPIE